MSALDRAQIAYRPEPESDEQIIRRYAPCIDRLARQISMRVRSPDLEGDLWSVGALGLLDAARRFDVARGIKFETFVEHRIRGAMLDELRRLDHLPRRLRTDADRVVTERRKLSDKLGRPASSEELSEELGMEIGDLQQVEALTQPLLPLLEPDNLGSAQDPSPEDQVSRRQTAASLAQAVSILPERQQLVLSLYYVEGFTYREIAKTLGVSEPRICQIHGEAVIRLRAALTTPE